MGSLYTARGKMLSFFLLRGNIQIGNRKRWISEIFVQFMLVRWRGYMVNAGISIWFPNVEKNGFDKHQLSICQTFARLPTGSPSSSCEMILLRNKNHGENMRVCMGIFTTALWNKTWKYSQIFAENGKCSALLVFWPPTFSQRGHFSELYISRFTTPKRRRNLS